MHGLFAYDERQSVDGVQTYSPSAAKPARFMQAMEIESWYTWRHHRLPVTAVTREDLYLVHAKDYVDAVFNGTVQNGFGNYDPRVPESCLWTVGSLASAVLQAPSVSLPVCSPTSGFHHAHYDHGEGYCTFNGILVAAAKYLAANPGHKVGILDCDFHYGNGTDDILAKLPALAKDVVHHTSGKHFHPEDDPLDFFQWLHHSIEDINSQGCDVTIYQAGADMHIDDPLGGLLDDGQMLMRERMVFSELRGAVVWNLAGGYRRTDSTDVYQDPVIRTHLNTVKAVNMTSGRRAALNQPLPKKEGVCA